MSVRIVALVPDLMVAVRLREAGKRAGTRIDLAESEEELLQRLQSGEVTAIVLDLGVLALDLRAIATAAHEHGVPALAFGPHVDRARLKAAREAGIERVYARGKFLRELTAILREIASA